MKTSIKLQIVTALLLFNFLNLFSQIEEVELTIDVEQDGSKNLAAWVHLQHASNDNIGGWYQRRGPKGFPTYFPVSINAPLGEVTISVWNSNSDLVKETVVVEKNQPLVCKIKLPKRFDLHEEGYYSFDSHNHLNGYDAKNRPPLIYPYCAAHGIDHLDVGQGWMFGLRMPASYDSIINYLQENSTPELSLHFGAEYPKLRFGHTWYINHPGLNDPLGDYLDWHDVEYFETIHAGKVEGDKKKFLRDSLHPTWHPPFVDRLLSKKKGALAFAAHPTRWWHDNPNELFPTTNIAADLAFDLLTARSYDGIVVMGDRKDNLYYQYLWFHLLNRGHRLVPVAESDGNVNGGSLGYHVLTHVWTGKERYNLNDMVDHVKAGYTMVSGKAVMILTVDGKYPPGSEFLADGNPRTIHVKVFSEPSPEEYVSFLVLYRNGEMMELIDLRDQKKREVEHQFEIREKETAWYLVKSYGKEYPAKEIEFDILKYAEYCNNVMDEVPKNNSGISFTAPVFFNGPDWEPPRPIISNIQCTILDREGKPLKNWSVEVWNVDERLAELRTDENGVFMIQAPGTIDIRFRQPDGTFEQQWLFYEYPPLVSHIEGIYTLSWIEKYPGIRGGQMPWEEFKYDEIKKLLKDIDWIVTPKGRLMNPGPLY